MDNGYCFKHGQATLSGRPCSACAILKAALDAITALDNLASAVEDFSGIFPDRATHLIDLNSATHAALRVRKAIKATEPEIVA